MTGFQKPVESVNGDTGYVMIGLSTRKENTNVPLVVLPGPLRSGADPCHSNDRRGRRSGAASTGRRGCEAERLGRAAGARRRSKLPRVLLIGDSILGGYNGKAGELLRGKVNLDAWITPKHIGNDLAKDLQGIFGEHTYDLILFNDIGLHAWTPGRIPEGQYEPLTRAHLANLRKFAPKARLIFATTTPMTTKTRPIGFDPEFNSLIIERNKIAVKVMTENNVPVADYYGSWPTNWSWPPATVFIGRSRLTNCWPSARRSTSRRPWGCRNNSGGKITVGQVSNLPETRQIGNLPHVPPPHFQRSTAPVSALVAIAAYLAR